MHWPFRKHVDCFNGCYVVPVCSFYKRIFGCIRVFIGHVVLSVAIESFSILLDFVIFLFLFSSQKICFTLQGTKNTKKKEKLFSKFSQVQLRCIELIDQSTPFPHCAVHLCCTLLSRWSTKLLWMNFFFCYNIRECDRITTLEGLKKMYVN